MSSIKSNRKLSKKPLQLTTCLSSDSPKTPNFSRLSKCGCEFVYKFNGGQWIREGMHREQCMWK
jgi:hypothetical protein